MLNSRKKKRKRGSACTVALARQRRHAPTLMERRWCIAVIQRIWPSGAWRMACVLCGLSHGRARCVMVAGNGWERRGRRYDAWTREGTERDGVAIATATGYRS